MVHPHDQTPFTVKRNKLVLMHAIISMNLEYRIKKSDIRDYLLYDPIYTKCSEKATLQRQEVEKRSPTTAGGGGECLQAEARDLCE